MGSSWKAMADDNRRQMLLLLKDGEKTPTEMAKSFEFTLPAVSTHLRVLKDAGLVSERKVGQNRFYSVNKAKMTEMVEFFDIFWGDRLNRLKEHVENKKAKEDDRR
jgi:ArsR family transcriptional regulator, arsenate/arsenite/antimonite-responsive transcriptional repressor